MMVIPVIYFIALAIFGVGTYNSPDTIYKYTGITNGSVFWVAFGVMCILRLKQMPLLTPRLAQINSRLVFPITTIVTVALTILDYVTPPNFVFAYTRIQYTQVALIACFSGLVGLLGQRNTWFQRNHKALWFTGALITTSAAAIVWLFPFDVFAELSKEDHLIETLQVIALLLGAYFANRTAQRLWLTRQYVHAVICALAVVVLITVSGDEISWGQRILHITPPSFFAENKQQEITVHNMPGLDDKVNMGYILVGLYGSIAWIAPLIIPTLRRSLWRLYIPPWFASSYFFLGFVYNLIIRLTPYNNMGVWSEYIELLIYTGIVCTMWTAYVTSQHISSPFK
jgi:hypothetical protein